MKVNRKQTNFVLRRSSLWQFKNSVYLKQCISIPPPTHTQPTQHTYTLQLGHKHNKVIPASLLTQSHSWYFTANYPKLQNGIPGSNKNISIAFRFADFIYLSCFFQINVNIFLWKTKYAVLPKFDVQDLVYKEGVQRSIQEKNHHSERHHPCWGTKSQLIP